MRGFLGLMVVGMTLVSGAAHGAELGWTGLTVRVYDNANVPKGALRAALDTAAQTLRPADVEVAWVTCSVSSGGRCTVPLGRGELMVRLVRSVKSAPGTDDESLGTALVDPATGSGVLATVYVDRVEMLAHGTDSDLGMLLGRAMAHEIGHLLMGRSAHARHGLMRPRWTRAEITRNVSGDWGFEAQDVRAIRARRGYAVAADLVESAAFTRAGVNGISRSRAPVASNTALPIAAATTVMAVSPAPLAGADGWLTSTASTAGVREPTANVR
jgi:hypothetical protein